MDKKRLRRRKRRDFPKPNAAIVTLSALTFFLLLLWGGLHMREVSERKLVAAAAENQEQAGALQEYRGSSHSAPNVRYPAETDGSYSPEDGRSLTPSAVDGSAASDGDPDEKPERQAIPQPNVPNRSESKAGAGAGDGKSAGSRPDSVIDPETSNSALTEPESPVSSDTGTSETTSGVAESSQPSQSPEETGKSGTEGYAQPYETPTITDNNRMRNYEEEIKEVQAQCAKEMKTVMVGAENGWLQVDKRDPYAIQTWQTSLTKEMAAAESECDNRFRDLTRDAEKDSESPEVIEEWRRAFNAAKEEIKAESNAKAAKLIGG
ncbi:hypothetical protein [Cohnella sp.]|uniref:hypothetical protein n=1 Tax=Cohnella sp. TaxID=1883426 RepID=UPI0037048332